MNLLLIWLLSSLGFFITSKIVSGFEIKSFGSAMIASAVVGLFNVIFRPILLFLTLPLNIITLGLFTFVVNAIVLKMASGILKGFNIKSWGVAIIGAIVLALVNMLLYWLLPSEGYVIQEGTQV